MSLASANGSVEVVKVLLEFEAQVNLPNDVRWRIQFETAAFNVPIVTYYRMNGATWLFLLRVRVAILKQPEYYWIIEHM